MTIAPALTRRLLLAAAGTLAAPGVLRAQAFPSRPVRIVVPFAPGGPADTMARLAARVLEPRLGQAIVVENRAGAGGNIAAEHVARSAPDGYTLLLAGQGILAINHVLTPRLTYDPVRDFAFLGMFGITANVILAHPQAARAPIPGRSPTAPSASARCRISRPRCWQRRRACSSCTSPTRARRR